MADEQAHDAAPGAGPSSEADDELAKGLPGLPIERGKLRVDECGIHRKGGLFRRCVDVPWRDVASVRLEDVGVVLEAPRPDGSVGKLFEEYKSPSTRRAVISAWREYLLRSIERDGVLHGTLMSRPRGWSLFHVALGAVFCGGAVSWGIDHYYPSTGVLWTLPAFLPFIVGVLFVNRGIDGWRTEPVTRSRWKRWELGKEGLVFQPGGEKTAVVPSKGDVVTPVSARIRGERVPLGRLTRRPIVVEILLALGERNGAHVRGHRGSPWKVLWLGLVALLAVLLIGRFAEGCKCGADAFFVVCCIAATVMWWVLERFAFRHALSSGRAMLDRLGW